MTGVQENIVRPNDPGFAEEFGECWRQLPNKGFFFTLLAAWLLLFQFLGNCTFGYIATPSLLHWMWRAYTGGDQSDEHGLVVPVAVLGLLWWKRKEIMAQRLRTWSPGIVIFVTAILLHVVGYLVQQQRISIIALFLGIYGLMGMAWGPGMLRTSLFPFFLLGFCIPVATIAEPVTFRMRILVCQIVTTVAPLIGVDVVRVGTALTNPAGTYQYEVAAACSGLRSVVAILCIATVYAFMNFRGLWKRGIVILSAFPLAILGNVIRLMFVIVAAEVGGQAVGERVHENGFFSLLPYLPAVLGLVGIGWLLGNRKATHG